MSRCEPDTNWWEREDLTYLDGRLHLSGQCLEHLARSAGEPVFVYSARRVASNLGRLRECLGGLPQSTKVLYAMKANRFLPLLSELRRLGVDGVDVCSPDEVLRARQVGFHEHQISFTGTSVSDADLEVLARHPGVWINCDSLSSLRRLGRRCPGRKIGLRINPRAGVGYRQNDQLRYSGELPTKFGIYRDRFEEALEVAACHDLQIAGLHLHAGCGYLDDQLENYRKVLTATLPFIERMPNLEHLNLGGGLGIPLVQGDAPLDLAAWTGVVADVLGGLQASIWIEPGDYLVKDTGILVLEVNTVEEKDGCRFIGVNGGFNLHIEPAFYRLPLHPVPCRFPTGSPSEVPVPAQVVGNINEALDILHGHAILPGLREGDYLAFLNAGGYGSSMSSNHCMRGRFSEYLIV